MATEKQVLYMTGLAEYTDMEELLDPKRYGVSSLYQLTNRQVSEILEILQKEADQIASLEEVIFESEHGDWGCRGGKD